jgi:ParB family chromosome partitioning protein
VEDTAFQLEMSKRVLEAALSVREAERLAKRWSGEGAGVLTAGHVSRETSRYQEDPNVAEIEARLRELFRTKVRLVINKDRGRIEIEFYSSEDLERLLNLLAGA